MSTKTYEGESIEVSFDLTRCIHAGHCVRSLPGVFDTDRRPWIDPDQADPDELARTIEGCPSGALHYRLLAEDAAEEQPDDEASVTLRPDGPLYLRGLLTIVNGDGERMHQDNRLSLCRCGASENKPYCDNAHKNCDFSHDGRLNEDIALDQERDEDWSVGEEVEVHVRPRGPLILSGCVRLEDSQGEQRFKHGRLALCRCGASKNKPLCDGSHAHIGFED